MQSLRRASRGTNQAAAAIRGTFIGSQRTYCAGAAPRVCSPRKSREERHELVMKFIEKYKMENNGRLPTVTLVRKEVGGKYELLKEIFDGMEKGEDKAKSIAQSAPVGKVEEKTKESTPAAKGSGKKLSTSAEKETKQGKKVVKEVELAGEEPKEDKKVAKSKESTDEDSKSETPQLQRNKERKKAASKSATKDGQMEVSKKMKPVMTIPDSITDDDDDSDVAAPEYDYRPQPQTEEHLRAAKMKGDLAQEVDSKNDLKRLSLDQAIKSKASFEVKAKEIVETGPDIGNFPFQSMEEGVGKYSQLDFVSGHSKLLRKTSVVRLVNLPIGIKPDKIKALCQNVVNVHDVEMRRPRIADVHLNLKDPNQVYEIIPRLRKIIYGNMLKVFPAQRFACGGGNKEFKPQNAQQLKQVRDNLFHQFEQRFINLRCQVQDYRQLLAMKREMSESK